MIMTSTVENLRWFRHKIKKENHFYIETQQLALNVQILMLAISLVFKCIINGFFQRAERAFRFHETFKKQFLIYELVDRKTSQVE